GREIVVAGQGGTRQARREDDRVPGDRGGAADPVPRVGPVAGGGGRGVRPRPGDRGRGDGRQHDILAAGPAVVVDHEVVTGDRQRAPVGQPGEGAGDRLAAGVVQDRVLVARRRDERRADRDVQRGGGQVDGAAGAELVVIGAGRGPVERHVEGRA